MNVIIIGGGASGLMAACRLSAAGIKTTVLEKQDRVGRKLLSTGNGRCNLSNVNANVSYYHGSRAFVENALSAFSVRDTLRYFESIGVPCFRDDEGRVYPVCSQASGVLDALRLFASEQGTEIKTACAVERIEAKKGFKLICAGGEIHEASHVILAAGGMAAPKLGGSRDGYKIAEALGHKCTKLYPSLAALTCAPEYVRALKGIRVRCCLKLLRGSRVLRQEKGELLFSESGLSGIAAMQLSRDVRLQGGDRVSIDLLEDRADEGYILRTARALPGRSLEDFLSGVVPKRVAQGRIKAAAALPLSAKAADLTDEQCRRIEEAMRAWIIPVTGTLSFEAAQVTCGGLASDGFDPETLMSRKVPNFYAVGEVMDVDGDCGGFNLQWAWSSAALAVKSIIEHY